MISIDQDGNASFIAEPQEQQIITDQVESEEETITIDMWQWIILLVGIIVAFLIIRSSLINVQY